MFDKLKNNNGYLNSKMLDGYMLLHRDESRLPSKDNLRHETMIINEINLVLAEKRTSLSVMRTGIAVLALPISVLSVLVAISKFYDPMDVIYLLGPLLGLCAVLTVLGWYMIVTSLRRVNQLNRVIQALKQQNSTLRELAVVMDRQMVPDRDF